MARHDNPVGRETGAGSLVALVTGASGAIGKAIAERIAANHDYQVVLLCRDAQKGAAAVRDIQRRTDNPKVRYELVDVSRYSSIRALANRWQGPVDVLINNAAATPRDRQETPEGIELQWATNVLGYVWMIQAFRRNLERSSPSRVVNVASYWAGGLDLSDLEFKRRRYNNDLAYRQSKQANRMLTVTLAEELGSGGITVNACHPGDVNSTLSRNLGFGGHETPDEGARTPAWLATEATGRDTTGKYFEHMREVSCQFASDRHALASLYARCQSYDSGRDIG